MKILWIIIVIIILIIIWITLFVSLHPVFWGKSKEYESINFKNWKFRNIQNISLQTWWWGLLGTIKEYITSTTQRIPITEFPTIKFDSSDFKSWDFVWLWHSTVLMNLDNINIITDPVYYKASPIAIWWKPFKYSNRPVISDLPDIDIVLISHDHYDHLDYQSIIEMDSKVWKYIVPLWVKSHFIQWGIDEDKVIELDWQDSIRVNDITFVLTPAQHFSGRGILNWSSTLWWSWVIQWTSKNLYFSWDTWYFEGFKDIWNKYGPFDLAFIENGAYNDAWNQIHMYPEQSVQAGIDLQATNIMPIHWGKFDLSLHAWYEPIERFVQESKRLNQEYFHPRVGEIFTLNNLPKDNWWEELK